VSFEERNFSEATAQAIDEQVHRLIEEAHQTAKGVLTQRRAVLDVIANALLEKETLERGALEALVRGT
jgi:cell division protease FtsH